MARRPFWEWLDDRRGAKEYMHVASPWRRCGVRPCVPCVVRTITGQHRRRRARFIAEFHARRLATPLTHFGRKPDGRIDWTDFHRDEEQA